ncbi:DMT family transporter [Celerinatantimonas yamalensis]|uniref:EamA family transporter n=1 Tax=Celerinatantimonas yamalensis TaxID=559956 RepID=A0ABW9G7D6_9GAMM
MKKYLYLVAIGLLWGAQFVFMRQAVATIPDVWVAAGRALTGAATLWLLCKLLRLRGNVRDWPIYALIALVDAAVPFLLLAWAQQQVDSSISAVIMGMIPLLTLLFAPLVIGESLTLVAFISVLIGFAGIWVLFAPQLMGISTGLPIWPLLAILASAGCYAMGMLLVKRLTRESPLLVARNILSASALQLLVVALIASPEIPTVSLPALNSLLMLGVLSTGLGYFVFMALIALSGPTFASMSNYLVPVIGFLLGGWLLAERPPQSTLWALSLILLAVALNQWGQYRQKHDRDSVPT